MSSTVLRKWQSWDLIQICGVQNPFHSKLSSIVEVLPWGSHRIGEHMLMREIIIHFDF
jgi:hypothetical protein